MIIEVYKAMNKIKAGKAPGVCSIYPEYIQHGGSDALRTLHKIVSRLWEEEVVPKECHQNIIISLYKGEGSKSECSNYSGQQGVCSYHSCKNEINLGVTQASPAQLLQYV